MGEDDYFDSPGLYSAANGEKRMITVLNKISSQYDLSAEMPQAPGGAPVHANNPNKEPPRFK
jgi:hypothetical protein